MPARVSTIDTSASVPSTLGIRTRSTSVRVSSSTAEP
jgi:hypothetical protein